MTKQIEVRRGRSLPAAGETWRDFRNEMDRMFDRFADGFESFSLEPYFQVQKLFTPGTGFASMSVDVSDNDQAYTITAELPGVAEKDIEVSVHDDMLVIKGEKREEREEKGKNCYISERNYGTFQRMFGLPKGTEASKVQAGFHNGILSVTVPKELQKQENHKVEIKTA